MKNVQSLRNAVMVSLLAGTTLVWGGTAFAQEDLQEFTLEDMVVTASRVPTQKVDTPADISVITKEEIADQNYASASDALRAIPGVNVLGSGAKGSSMGQDKILLNGDERVLVLVDGRRMNLGSSGNSSAEVPIGCLLLMQSNVSKYLRVAVLLCMVPMQSAVLSTLL